MSAPGPEAQLEHQPDSDKITPRDVLFIGLGGVAVGLAAIAAQNLDLISIYHS